MLFIKANLHSEKLSRKEIFSAEKHHVIYSDWLKLKTLKTLHDLLEKEFFDSEKKKVEFFQLLFFFDQKIFRLTNQIASFKIFTCEF